MGTTDLPGQIIDPEVMFATSMDHLMALQTVVRNAGTLLKPSQQQQLLRDLKDLRSQFERHATKSAAVEQINGRDVKARADKLTPKEAAAKVAARRAARKADVKK